MVDIQKVHGKVHQAMAVIDTEDGSYETLLGLTGEELEYAVRRVTLLGDDPVRLAVILGAGLATLKATDRVKAASDSA